jgi:hypothetical protein
MRYEPIEIMAACDEEFDNVTEMPVAGRGVGRQDA